ncbi:D-alanyl-D-alanine carboxypeptidase [Sphingobacterium rhinopitheci]|uniref:D-alanyl-D-alanine carboxypeptidase n=1 Tax=Sphingobacterium rhinopitheci TaxID=2781960 RepID=UPI001F51F11D|nr:D-alanyl-D-alanine carboxypeptidase [Sphingobacterium rhinopitheci]MCI0921218.1 D-alanyl-D-alanine carboxypeptidase [Sphingobacterium rhinopitheci]
MMYCRLIVALLIISFLGSCSIKKSINKNVNLNVQSDSLLNTAFVGFKIIDLDTKEVLEESNAANYFIPASNTKLLSMYSAIRTFGDSIPGWFIAEDHHTLYIEPNADPSFMHSDFKEQKLFDLLCNTNKKIVLILPSSANIGRFGAGWSWNSHLYNYAVERSVMPMYANLVRFAKRGNNFYAVPSFFTDSINNVKEEVDHNRFVRVERDEQSNSFVFSNNSNATHLVTGYTRQQNEELPFLLLRDTLVKRNPQADISLWKERPEGLQFKAFYTVPTDDLLGIMMKRSDNFIAEQILLMVGKYNTGEVSDYITIKNLRNTLFADVLDAGRWADGSGLSRNNLISPNEYINLLGQINTEGIRDRVIDILPAGNQGTLSGLYLGYEPNIAAKTGTLADHLGLSGYLKTKKNTNLAFSFLINNHRGNANDYRKKIEEVLIWYIENK